MAFLEVAVDTGKTPAIVPTITVTDASKEAQPDGVSQGNAKGPPGAMPDGPAPQIPDWYKAGWRAVGGIDDPQTEGAEKDKTVIDMFLNEQMYGAWYHNAGIVFFVRLIFYSLSLGNCRVLLAPHN